MDRLGSEVEGKRELVEAELLGRNLHPFLRGMWQVVEPGRQFEDNWHIGAICEVLEAVSRFELKCVGVNVPFRSTKRMTVGEACPPWEWANRPSPGFLF